MSVTVPCERNSIRARIRELRRSLSSAQQASAAGDIVRKALTYPPVQQAKHLAVFLSVDGELDTRPLIDNLWQQNKHVYLPVLHPFAYRQLLFLRYTPETILVPNRLGIPEPVLDIRHLAPLSMLDIMMVPLVAFDQQGQRLGMGGGFYDRTLQNWSQKGFLPVGLAHDCQRVESLTVASWDIPLPVILTPSEVWEW